MRPVLALIAIVSLGSALEAADASEITWKLNVEKSKLHNPVQSYLLKIELIAPKTHRLTWDIVSGDGTKRHQELVRIADGKEHVSEGMNVPAGTSEIVSEDFAKVIHKRDGKTVYQMTVIVASDGKSQQAAVTGVDGNGKPYQDLEVFDRQ